MFSIFCLLLKFDVFLFRAREGDWGAEKKKDSLGKEEDNLRSIRHLKVIVIVLWTKPTLIPFAKQSF